MSKRHRIVVMAVAAVMPLTGGVLAGDLTPPGPPGATMRTLQEIYDRIEEIAGYVGAGDADAGDLLSGKTAWVNGAQVTGTMTNVGKQDISPSTVAQTITQGYHDGTGEVAGDADLVAENIKMDVTIFGVKGTHEGGVDITYDAALPKTGQTTSYRTGDDGALQKGVAWPNPRFTEDDDGTVTDGLTGLMWVKAPHSLSGNSEGQTWNNAIDYCNTLVHGDHTDWRLPNVRELQSLIDYGRSAPALPSGYPFTGVQSSYYWSSSTYAENIEFAWQVHLGFGYLYHDSNLQFNYVWPVRGGQ